MCELKKKEQLFEALNTGTREEKLELLEHILQTNGISKDREVRKFVIDALPKDKSDEVRELIRNRLDDPETNKIYTAIEFLGDLKDQSSVKKIEDILFTSANLMVVCACLEALAKIQLSPRKERIVEKFLKQNNAMLIFPFLKYLGTFGNKESLQYVGRVIDLNPQMFTKEVIDSVEGIMNNNNLEELPESLKLKLEKMVDEIDNDVNKHEIIKILTKSAGGS